MIWTREIDPRWHSVVVGAGVVRVVGAYLHCAEGEVQYHLRQDADGCGGRTTSKRKVQGLATVGYCACIQLYKRIYTYMRVQVIIAVAIFIYSPKLFVCN